MPEAFVSKLWPECAEEEIFPVAPVCFQSWLLQVRAD